MSLLLGSNTFRQTVCIAYISNLQKPDNRALITATGITKSTDVHRICMYYRNDSSFAGEGSSPS